jgi:hypothetical protein
MGVFASLGYACAVVLGPPSPTVDAPPSPTGASEARDLQDHREPPPPTISQELRRATTSEEHPKGGGVRDDVLGDRAVDQIRVHTRPDGSVEVEMPRSVRMRAAGCTLGRCLGRRKIDRQSDKTIPGATAPIMLGISGTFGWTPASPRDATRLLERTREQRVQQAIAYQRRMLARSAGEISMQLAALLHDTALAPARRREIVFQLWQDAVCSASSVGRDDPLAAERSRAAHEARIRIERFVQRFLARGSPVGYSEAELARLSGRCASRPFRPYATADAPARDASPGDAPP